MSSILDLVLDSPKIYSFTKLDNYRAIHYQVITCIVYKNVHFDLCDLKIRSMSPTFELDPETPKMYPCTNLVILSQFGIQSSHSLCKITHFDFCGLKSVSPILEHIWDTPKMHPYTKFGHPSSICYQFIAFYVKIIYFDLCDHEK